MKNVWLQYKVKYDNKGNALPNNVQHITENKVANVHLTTKTKSKTAWDTDM